MSLIDQIQILNPFDLKPGIFRYTIESVVVIHKIDVVNGLIKLSKGHININNLVVDKAVFNYEYETFLEVYASEIFDTWDYEYVDYLTLDQYDQLRVIFEASQEG